MADFVTRAEWKARPPTSTTPISLPAPKLYLHHAAGAVVPGDDSVTDADLQRIKNIQNYHMDTQGWTDIAYNYLLDPDGYWFEGRTHKFKGGATAGENSVSLAICVMGNYETQKPTSRLISSIAELVRYGHGQGWWPDQITGGHRDAPNASTSCPGRYLYAEIPTINALALAGEDMPLSQADLDAIWQYPVPDEDDGVGTRGAVHALRQTWKYSKAAGAPTLPAVDIQAIAVAVADELQRRLEA